MRTPELLALLATGLVATSVHAQATTAYPARPVRVIVAFTAGGTTDIVARAVTQSSPRASSSRSSSRTSRARAATSAPNTPFARRPTATR